MSDVPPTPTEGGTPVRPEDMIAFVLIREAKTTPSTRQKTPSSFGSTPAKQLRPTASSARQSRQPKAQNATGNGPPSSQPTTVSFSHEDTRVSHAGRAGATNLPTSRQKHLTSHRTAFLADRSFSPGSQPPGGFPNPQQARWNPLAMLNQILKIGRYLP